MNILGSIRKRLSALRRGFCRFPEQEPRPISQPLDLQFLEDRVLFSAVPLAAEVLAAQSAGTDFAGGFGELSDPTTLAHFDVATGTGTDACSFGTSDSIAQVEASLEGLDALLAQLAALERESQFHENTLASSDLSEPLVLESQVPDAADWEHEAHPADSERSHELIVVDASLPEYEQLISSWRLDQHADSEFSVLLVDRSVDGVQFVGDYLASSDVRFDAIHLVTHGFVGGMQLGNIELTASNLNLYASQFDVWRSSLSEDADLFLYGCSIASGSTGTEFVNQLSNLMNVDIAASLDWTGAVALGGDWTLEYTQGSVEISRGLGYSVELEWQFILSSNNAPVLDASVSPTFGSVLEGASNPSGVTIASLVVDGSITDADGSATEAIAITGLNTSLGSWQYSLNGGTSWLTINAGLINSQTNELALLLGPTAQLRLIPFGDLNGSVSDAITFRAWDQSAGSEGQYVVITSTGGSSAFSSASDTASISVTAVKDAPTFFMGDGIVTTSISSGLDAGHSIALLPDGKVMVAGNALVGGNQDFAIARYSADGSLDTSFGSGGIVTTAIGSGNDYGYSVTVQPDGKFLVSGSATIGGTADFALVRYHANGSLDTSFGTGGIVTTRIGTSDAFGYDVSLSVDGKIVVAGYARMGSNADFAIARYLSDGSLDTSFGSNGIVTTAIGTSNDVGLSATVQSDGKILVGGHAVIGTTSTFALVRYDNNGMLDASFGTGGVVTTDLFMDHDQGWSLTVQSDGKILVGGQSVVDGSNDFALVRYHGDGSLDTSFGSNGVVTTAIGSGDDQGRSITVQSDGKILVLGKAWIDDGDYFALVRYEADGSLDSYFGTGGIVTTPVGSSFDIGMSVEVQPDGKIVVGGYSTFGSASVFTLIRYHAYGQLDDRFNLVNTMVGTVIWQENNETPVVLNSDAHIFDSELNSTHFGGSSLILHRNSGANSQDIFSATGHLGPLDQGESLILGGENIGTVVSNSGGILSLVFNSNATATHIEWVMRLIAYANSSTMPPASLQILWTFSDGNSGDQGSGGALTATGNIAVNIYGVNQAPVLSFATNARDSPGDNNESDRRSGGFFYRRWQHHGSRWHGGRSDCDYCTRYQLGHLAVQPKWRHQLADNQCGTDQQPHQ